MTHCPHCNAPLVNLLSQNVKLCVDNPVEHVIDNKLKDDQKVLIKAQR